jgi:uncharacterized membrane protein YfcA
MDWAIYWFGFPLALGVTTTASLCGIGDAVLFTPILIGLLPLLEPKYLLQSAIAAVGAAPLTQCLSFTSAFFSYYRRRLSDFKTAIPFEAVGLLLGISARYLHRPSTTIC